MYGLHDCSRGVVEVMVFPARLIVWDVSLFEFFADSLGTTEGRLGTTWTVITRIYVVTNIQEAWTAS
jgi:hypothetical protein